MRTTAMAILVAAFVWLPAPAIADWLVSVDTGLVFHDNVGRSRLSVDERSESIFEVDVSLDRPLPWRTEGLFRFRLQVGADHYFRYDDLRQVRLGAGLNYHRRLALGPEAPWLSADLQLVYHEFSGQLRDGFSTRTALAAGRGWDNGFDLRATLSHDRHRGRGGETGLSPHSVFRTAAWQGRIELDWAAAAHWGLFAGLGWLRGDINTSTASPDVITGRWTDDPTFGPAWRTYRVGARVVTWTLGAHFGLGEATGLTVATDRLDGRASSSGADYDGQLLRVQLSHRF